ncbi:MAG: hypothetical protein KDA25_02010 [Phycisphaerales bacterium]|nr:hypothetical protein [Phycisphaerales bacterium]
MRDDLTTASRWCAATFLGAVAGLAAADWPSDPASPLVLGEMLGARSHVMATTPDGATWVAWVDGECFGTLRLQRIDVDGTVLDPEGLALDTRDDCVSRDARLAACPDGSVVVTGTAVGGSSPDSPIHRIGPDGAPIWTAGVVLPGIGGAAEQMLGLAGGDALVAWHVGMVIFVQRYAPDGSPVWDAPAEIITTTGPNKRIFGLEPDGADGAFVAWDNPLTYTRLISAARVGADGAVVFGQQQIAPPNPGSSRHTDPVAIADHAGGVTIVWTQSAESATTPVPLRMQHLLADGTPTLDADGARISLDSARQYHAVVGRDATTGDLFVVWRDGGFAGQTVRAQRLGPGASRLWGDGGIAVAPIAIGGAGRFDASWSMETLSVVAVDPVDPGDASVRVYRIDAGGGLDPAVVAASDTTMTGGVRASATEAALVTTWVRGPVNGATVVAQSVNPDGTLGGVPDVFGDLTGDGAVNAADLAVLLASWGRCAAPCVADLNGDGAVGPNDLGALLGAWTG